MSDLFAMSDDAADQKLAAAAENSVDSLAEMESPTWRGTGSGLGMGFMRGFAKVADALGIAVGGTAAKAVDESRELLDTGEAAAESSGNILSAILSGRPQSLAGGVPIRPDSTHTEAQDAVFGATDEVTRNAIDHWTPRANEVGRVGQVLGGLGEVGAELVAGLGTPYAMVGTSTAEGGKELVDEGVDAGTAGAAAALEGAASYAGLKAPIAGKTLLSRIATGIAGNVALGAGSREGEKLLLESQGYDDQAKGFTTDLASVSTDALLGALFGVTHHTLSPRINPKLTPAQADAVLAARNAKSFQEGMAPGTAVDIRANVASQEAAADTLERLSRGQAVDVGEAVARHEGASFTPDGKIEESADLTRIVEEEAPSDDGYVVEESGPEESVQLETEPAESDYSVAEGELTDEQLAQFKGLRSDVPADENVGGSRARDAEQPGREDDGVARREPLKVFRGASRELGAEDFRDEALGHATGHPSSGLGVFFTNSASHAENYGPVSEHLLDIRNPKIIPVEDLQGFDDLADATAFREELRAQGYDGIVIDASHVGGPVNYVAFGHEQVLRAKKTAIAQDARLEDPARREALEQLRDKIGLTERGGIGITDSDPIKPVSLGRTIHVGDPLWMNRPGADTNQGISRASALSALDRVRDGKPLGAAQARFVKYALDELDNVTRDSADYVNDAATPKVSPEIDAAHEYLGEQGGKDSIGELAALRQLAAERPDAIVYGGFDADGQPVKTTIAEEYARIQREFDRDIEDTKAYEAAVNCFLGHGA
jgi:hypothetical protein